MKRFVVLCSVMLAAACATVAPRDESSPYFVVPAGSTLALNTDVEIPANSARVFIQDGKTVPYNEVNLWYPHCTLEVQKVIEAPQRVRQDEFAVHKVKQDMSFHTAAVEGLRLARGAPLLFASLEDGGGPMMYLTELYLRSAAQPDVMRLTCRQLGEASSHPEHVTIREMRQALGELFTLRLAQPQP